MFGDATDPAIDPGFNWSLGYGGVSPDPYIVDPYLGTGGTGGSTVDQPGSSFDWGTFAGSFGKIAQGIATITTAGRGGVYTIGPQGITSGYGAGIGAPGSAIGSSLGITGGISTTTLLLLLAAAAFVFLKK